MYVDIIELLFNMPCSLVNSTVFFRSVNVSRLSPLLYRHCAALPNSLLSAPAAVPCSSSLHVGVVAMFLLLPRLSPPNRGKHFLPALTIHPLPRNVLPKTLFPNNFFRNWRSNTDQNSDDNLFGAPQQSSLL